VNRDERIACKAGNCIAEIQLTKNLELIRRGEKPAIQLRSRCYQLQAILLKPLRRRGFFHSWKCWDMVVGEDRGGYGNCHGPEEGCGDPHHRVDRRQVTRSKVTSNEYRAIARSARSNHPHHPQIPDAIACAVSAMRAPRRRSRIHRQAAKTEMLAVRIARRGRVRPR
jgi:hypothetical protein